MKTSLRYREGIRDARRVVVKVGTRVLVRGDGKPDTRRMSALVGGVARLRRAGYQVVLVTSGAIGAGMEALGMTVRPTLLPDLQMAAAVGQCRLMTRYDRLFAEKHCLVGQVLLTRDDFRRKLRMNNARRTIENLLRNGVVPIVNENDVVASEEIQADMSLGDNDQLSALLSKLVRADLMIILTTVDGVLRPKPDGTTERIRCLEAITAATYRLVSDKKGGMTRGGMMSKLRAAQSVARSGVSVVVANGCKAGVLDDIFQGKDVGTFILGSV